MENKVLAVVNNREITDLDIDAIIAKYPKGKREVANTENGRKKLLDQIISCEMMYLYALDMKLDKTEEYNILAEEAIKGVLTDMAIKKAIGTVTATEEEALKYYNENIKEFEVEDMISAKHILVESMEEALKVKDEIEKEKISFNDAALKYSICPSNMNGGSLGSFGKGKMVVPFEEAAFSAKIGVLTEPVETEFGFHLILVEDFREGYMKEFVDVKEEIIDSLINKKEFANYKNVMEEVKSKYKIKIMK